MVPINPGITRGRITELCWRISLIALSKIQQFGLKELLLPSVHPPLTHMLTEHQNTQVLDSDLLLSL